MVIQTEIIQTSNIINNNDFMLIKIVYWEKNTQVSKMWYYYTDKRGYRI